MNVRRIFHVSNLTVRTWTKEWMMKRWKFPLLVFGGLASSLLRNFWGGFFQPFLPLQRPSAFQRSSECSPILCTETSPSSPQVQPSRGWSSLHGRLDLDLRINAVWRDWVGKGALGWKHAAWQRQGSPKRKKKIKELNWFYELFCWWSIPTVSLKMLGSVMCKASTLWRDGHVQQWLLRSW